MKFPSLRRKKTEDPTLPKEVQAYYEAEQRDRRGVAGMLAVGTLIVTILIAAGLFFGGRWAYRSIRHTDKKKPNVATTGTSSTQTDTPSSSADTPAPSDSSSASNNASSNSSGTDSATSTSTSSTGAASATSSATSSSNLPTTGSDGSVMAFIGATIGSIVIAELYQRRKLTR
jgi:cytoskeletal protein RodZ